MQLEWLRFCLQTIFLTALKPEIAVRKMFHRTFILWLRIVEIEKYYRKPITVFDWSSRHADPPPSKMRRFRRQPGHYSEANLSAVPRLTCLTVVCVIIDEMTWVWFDRRHIRRYIEFESIDHTAQTTVSLRYRDQISKYEALLQLWLDKGHTSMNHWVKWEPACEYGSIIIWGRPLIGTIVTGTP